MEFRFNSIEEYYNETIKQDEKYKSLLLDLERQKHPVIKQIVKDNVRDLEIEMHKFNQELNYFLNRH